MARNPQPRQSVGPAPVPPLRVYRRKNKSKGRKEMLKEKVGISLLALRRRAANRMDTWRGEIGEEDTGIIGREGAYKEAEGKREV